jgi:hypothetical protein
MSSSSPKPRKGADDTAKKVPGVPFKSGAEWNGNKAGRPKGSRSKLGEDFLAAMQADFAKHGPAVIATVRDEKPDAYLKVIASILPKEVNLRTGPLDEMSDDDIASALDNLRQLLGTGLVPASGSGTEKQARH